LGKTLYRLGPLCPSAFPDAFDPLLSAPGLRVFPLPPRWMGYYPSANLARYRVLVFQWLALGKFVSD
jgi:hypothetical protein